MLPIAEFANPLQFASRDLYPNAVLYDPALFENKALDPTAVFCIPSSLDIASYPLKNNAESPTATIWLLLLLKVSALTPTAVFECPNSLLCKALSPIAVLANPEVS